jgi:S-adenosylmethionine hydrolase
MALLTITSDYGTTDHYAASLRIAANNAPFPKIIEITHGIELCSIAQAAYAVKSVFRDCPKESVHLIAVAEDFGDAMFFRFENHFFVTADNGLIGLISNNSPEKVLAYRLKKAETKIFPAKNIFMPAALQLIAGVLPEKIGEPTESYVSRIFLNASIDGDKIIGKIIKKDFHGNLVSNISREIFETVRNERDFRIVFSVEKLDKIHEGYASVQAGDCGVFFNESGFLEIFICQGNAADLLGMNFDSTIKINFFSNK